MRKKKNVIMAAALAGLVFCLSGANVQSAYASDENRLVQSGDGLYYVDAEGNQVKNQWVQIQDRRGGQFAGGWYYFDSKGRAFNYGGTTGVKKQINGKTYAFDDNGRMMTGWLDENWEPLDAEASPITAGVYYAGEDGALLKDQWFQYSYDDEIMKDDTARGPYGTAYSDYSEIWMYFDSNFKRVKADEGRTKHRVINGVTYGFDDHGVMLPWWNPAATGSDAQPAAQEPDQFFTASGGGGLLKDSWFWMYPSRAMDEKDYDNQEYSWWHTDQNGKLYKNRIKKINGKNYAFDKLGRMQTGFVIFNGSSGFSMQYDVDQWTSDDFRNGEVIGTNSAGNKLYLFGPDELNDGSMKTGKNIKVELSDGTFTFGFSDNGVAYGNGNKLRKAGDAFYINGLRLDADESFKYGVVRDTKGNCYVVDTNGRRVTGDRKVLKDGEGGYILLIKSRFMARVEDDDKPRWHNGPEGPGFYHYDSGSREKYGTLIAGYGSEPDPDSLPEEERLYIN